MSGMPEFGLEYSNPLEEWQHFLAGEIEYEDLNSIPSWLADLATPDKAVAGLRALPQIFAHYQNQECPYAGGIVAGVFNDLAHGYSPKDIALMHGLPEPHEKTTQSILGFVQGSGNAQHISLVGKFVREIAKKRGFAVSVSIKAGYPERNYSFSMFLQSVKGQLKLLRENDLGFLMQGTYSFGPSTNPAVYSLGREVGELDDMVSPSFLPAPDLSILEDVPGDAGDSFRHQRVDFSGLNIEDGHPAVAAFDAKKARERNNPYPKESLEWFIAACLMENGGDFGDLRAPRVFIEEVYATCQRLIRIYGEEDIGSIRTSILAGTIDEGELGQALRVFLKKFKNIDFRL